MDTKETLNDPTQYGNAKGSSTTHYLIKLTDEAYSSTDVGKATTAITIDYSKAFDLVDHNILIDKLVKLGVRAKIIILIISFLSDRSHYTKIGDKISNTIKITCGVPQGTISGPRLFTILINGVKCNLVSSYKFVDDKTLAYSYSGDPSEFLKNVLDIEIHWEMREIWIFAQTTRWPDRYTYVHLSKNNLNDKNFVYVKIIFMGSL